MLQDCDFKSERLEEAIAAKKAGQPEPEKVKKNYMFTKRKGKGKAKGREGKKKQNGKDKEGDEDLEGGPNGQADPVEHSLAVAKEFEPDIILLPRGSFKKLVPYRCLLCRTRQQPDGKVGECRAMKPYMIQHFLSNHFKSATHQRLLKARERQETNTDCRKVVKCEAISLGVSDSGLSGALFSYAKKFGIWARFANLQDTARHSYWFDASEGCWYIRAYGCKQEVEEQKKAKRNVCAACELLVKSSSIVRNCLRFCVKYFAALKLNALTFQGSEEVEALNAEIEALPSFQNDRYNFKAIMELNIGKLQQFVGTSFVCESSSSQVLKDWAATVVQPCLKLNVADISTQFQGIIANMGMALATGRCSEAEIANLKVAASAMSGALQDHPIVMGLALQSKRFMSKRDRGIDTMRGRRSSETDLEASIIADSGLQLALAAGNSSLAKEFGLPASGCRIGVNDLKKNMLPASALALLSEDQMKENFNRCDQKFPRESSAPKRVLAHRLGSLGMECDSNLVVDISGPDGKRWLGGYVPS